MIHDFTYFSRYVGARTPTELTYKQSICCILSHLLYPRNLFLGRPHWVRKEDLIISKGFTSVDLVSFAIGNLVSSQFREHRQTCTTRLKMSTFPSKSASSAFTFPWMVLNFFYSPCTKISNSSIQFLRPIPRTPGGKKIQNRTRAHYSRDATS